MEGTLRDTKRNKAHAGHLLGERQSNYKSLLINQIFANKTGRPGGHYNNGQRGAEENLPPSKGLLVATPYKLFTGYIMLAFWCRDAVGSSSHPPSVLSPPRAGVW